MTREIDRNSSASPLPDVGRDPDGELNAADLKQTVLDGRVGIRVRLSAEPATVDTAESGAERTSAEERAMAALGIVRSINLLAMALSTGIHLAAWITGRKHGRDLSPSAYTEMQQSHLRALGPVMRRLMPFTVLTNGAALLVSRRARARGIGEALGLLSAVTASATTVRYNLPINAYVGTWSPKRPPADWREQRDAWERWNAVRTAVSLVGTVALLLSAVGLIGRAGWE